MQEHTLTIPAKVNLYLEVCGRRADGYHEIETLFLPVPALTDRLALGERPDPGIEVVCAAEGVPGDRHNLVWRAAEAFAAAAGLQPRWRFVLEKGIPVGGGLGGGSADAAAALRLLNEAHGHPLAPAQTRELAASLGADVSFFLDPVPSVGRGIGERLQAVPGLVPPPLVIVNPGFPSATPWAYAHWQDVPRPAAPPLAGLLAALARNDLDGVAAHTYNALEFAVCRKFPLLAMLCEGLREAGCLAAHVSGSGASVYGICRPGAGATVAAEVQSRLALPLRIACCP